MSDVSGTVIRAHALHAPGLAFDEPPLALAATRPACPPDEAHTLLGRKGLLLKEPATRLALCAVHRALGLPPGRPTRPVPYAADTAVVVSSNLGNVATVCEVVAKVRARTPDAISPLQVPNASSNVIASSVAIRYGFGGPNLTVCSGATSGLDALSCALLLLAAHRAQRVVLVGVEPADPIVRRLIALRPRTNAPVALAACVVLEPGGSAGEVRVWPVRRHQTAPLEMPADAAESEPGVLRLGHRPEEIDLVGLVGETYGALGVLQVAVAAAWLQAGGATRASVTCGDPDDGYASVWLERIGGAGGSRNAQAETEPRRLDRFVTDQTPRASVTN